MLSCFSAVASSTPVDVDYRLLDVDLVKKRQMSRICLGGLTDMTDLTFPRLI